MAEEPKKQEKIDYDPQKDGSPEVAYKATQRSFWQSINNPGYITAGIATILIAGERAKSAFMKRLSRLDGYKDLFATQLTDIENAHKTANGDFKTFKEASDAATKQLEQGVKTRLRENAGIESGIPGLYQKFSVIEPYQKRAYFLTLATVASVAVGAITSFRRERKLSDEIHHQIANRAEDDDNAMRMKTSPHGTYQFRLPAPASTFQERTAVTSETSAKQNR